jgi:hypothetical protein
VNTVPGSALINGSAGCHLLPAIGHSYAASPPYLQGNLGHPEFLETD